MHYGKEVLCHELVCFFDNHRASCLHIQWPSILHQQYAIGKVIHPRMHLKRFVKFRKLEHERRRELGLKLPKDFGEKAHPTLGIAISFTSSTRSDNHRASCSHMQWPPFCINIRPRMHLKRFVKFRELDYGRRRELRLKLPKDLVKRLIPLLG